MKLRIRNLTRQTVVAEEALVADTPQSRRRGLLHHRDLPEGQGLVIVPCEGIHTFGMPFAIDVLFVGKSWKVLKVRRAMVQRRLAFCLRSFAVVELPAGMLEKTGTLAGDQLEYEKLP